MSDENELNESEMDQLLRELEQKSSSKPKEAKPPKAEVQPEKAQKKEEQKKKLPKEAPKVSEVANTSENPQKKPQAHGVSVVQRGSSESVDRKVSIFLFCLTTPILLAAVWMLGNYLASVVSVGWLIAIVALFGVLGLSYFFKRVVGKGRFMVWSGLVSLLLLVAMLLPATFSTTKMIEYGHWPMSSITQASGMETENIFVSFSNRVSKMLASFRAGFGEGEIATSIPRELGKETPLIPEVKPPEPEDGKEIPVVKPPEPKAEDGKEVPVVKPPEPKVEEGKETEKKNDN